MATSPNYGWLEPDNTDLVKNGALAIRTLGNAIDTTMATMTPKSTFTAKGSIAVATAASTPANLSVGSDGTSLVADSSTSTGLRWQGSTAAGRNFLINGAMDIWQRGTSFSVGTFAATYTADRWSTFNANACTISQESTIVPSGSRYALKLTGGATTSGYEIVQAIETANAIYLAGTTSIFSLQVAGTSGKTVTAYVDYSTSTDVAPWPNSGWTNISSATVTTAASNAFSTLSVIAAIPSTAKSIRVKIATGSLASGEVQYCGKAQLEVGSGATPFSRAGGTIQGELAACQRYYQRFTANSSYAYFSAAGVAYSATVTRNPIPLPVTMRIYPTALESATIAVTDSVTQYTSGTFSLTSDGTSSAPTIGYSHGSGALTQFRPYFIQAAGSTAAYIAFSAEL